MAKKKPSVNQQQVESDLQDLKNQVADLENKWKRALADYQNLEKRHQSERAQLIKLASIGLMVKLLPVMDDLERAAEHVHDSGLQMVVRKFLDVLAEEKVTPFVPDGEKFDPNSMECVETVAGKQDLVQAVTEKGYMYSDVVIRPAKVTVGNGQELDEKRKKNNEQHKEHA